MTLEDGTCGALLREKRPDARKQPDFPKVGPVLPDIIRAEDPVDWPRVSWEEMDCVRHISRPLAVERFDGVTMKMLIARWETGGVKEVWAAEMEKGFCAESNPYPLKTEMLYVTEGEIKVTVYDDTFIAHKECIVKLPKYGEYRIEALSDAVVYDVGGQVAGERQFDRRHPAQFDEGAVGLHETVVETQERVRDPVQAPLAGFRGLAEGNLLFQIAQVHQFGQRTGQVRRRLVAARGDLGQPVDAVPDDGHQGRCLDRIPDVVPEQA